MLLFTKVTGRSEHGGGEEAIHDVASALRGDEDPFELNREDRSMTERDIPNTNEIKMYLHCAICLKERPHDQSPKDWSRVQAGWTELGLQVWCTRHDANMLHVDFDGTQMRANTPRALTSEEQTAMKETGN